MTYSSGSDDELGAGAFVEELNDIRQIAKVRMMEFDQTVGLVDVSESVSESDVQEAHILFQAAVAAYISTMRPYIHNLEVYETDLLEEEDGDGEVTLADIIASQGDTREQTVECGDMFSPDEVQTIEVPDLVEPLALRNAVHVLVEKQKDMGFLPREREQSVKADPF